MSRIQSGEMSEFQGLRTEVNDKTVRIFGGILVSAIEGCSPSRVSQQY